MSVTAQSGDLGGHVADPSSWRGEGVRWWYLPAASVVAARMSDRATRYSMFLINFFIDVIRVLLISGAPWYQARSYANGLYFASWRLGDG